MRECQSQNPDGNYVLRIYSVYQVFIFCFVFSSSLVYFTCCVFFCICRRVVEGVHGSADGALPGQEGNAGRHEVRHVHQGKHRLRDTPGRGDETARQL